MSDFSLRRHQPLLHRADLGYQVCRDGTRAILSHGTRMAMCAVRVIW